MDPVSALGLAASIIACIQLAQSLSQNVGLTENNHTDLDHMLKTLRGFLAACECLKDIAALDESEGRFFLVEQAQEPLKKYQQAIDFIHEQLKEKNLFRRWVRGSAWDKKIKRRLSRLENIRAQFDIAIQPDQLYVILKGDTKNRKNANPCHSQIIAAVEKYSQQAVCDTRDIKEDTRGIKKDTRDLKDDTRDIKQDTKSIKGDTRSVREDTHYIKLGITQQGPLLSNIKSTQDKEVQGQQALS